MRSLKHFSLPLKGLKDGIHLYQFEVENDFFAKFENSPIENGKFMLDVELQKKSDHLELGFEIEGSFSTECDRCMANIMLPVFGEHKLIVKYTAEEFNNEEEVWTITHETSELTLDKAIYEFITLSIPMIKTFDCDLEIPVPCNKLVTEYLDYEEEDEDDDDKDNPFAEALKNIDLN